MGGDPYIGTEPRYLILKRQGYKVLILEKDLVFYKIDEENKQVIVYAVVDQRQDYLNIMNYIVPFCHYIRNTENTFMTGVRSVPSMALLQIVSGEADAQDLDLIIQKKS